MNSSFTVALAQPSPVPLLHVSGEKCLLFSSNYLAGLTLGMPILGGTAAAALLCHPVMDEPQLSPAAICHQGPQQVTSSFLHTDRGRGEKWQ